MKEVLEQYTPTDYLEVLPPLTREYAMSMFAQGADLTQIAVQISNEPGAGLATKGGDPWPKDIGARTLSEVHSLLCTEDSKYATIREKIRGEGATTANVLVFVVSNAVATHAGMAAALCVPLVALILAAGAKIGLVAWCRAYYPSPTQEILTDDQTAKPANPGEI